MICSSFRATWSVWRKSVWFLQTLLDTCSSVWGRPSQPALDVHIHPPAALGSGRAQLVHKIHAMLHVLLLEVGTWPDVSRYLATVRGVCTDYGTESKLADTQDIDVTNMFPWCAETCDFSSVVPEPSDDFQAPAQEDRPLQEYLVVRQRSAEDGGGTQVLLPRLFPLAMQVPGALHVLHHSVEELTDAFEYYAEWFFPRLQATVNILGKKYYRERFVAQSLRGTPGEVFEERILGLELNLHGARWGTLVCTCKELLAVRLASPTGMRMK